MAGNMITIEGYNNNTVSDLIIQFHEKFRTQFGDKLSNIKKRQGSILLMDNGSTLEPTDTLGNKGIGEGTELHIIYKGTLTCSCRNIPGSRVSNISPRLHYWIESYDEKHGTTFMQPDDPRQQIELGRSITKPISDRLEKINNWNQGANYVFLLTDAYLHDYGTRMRVMSSTHRETEPNVIYYSDNADNKMMVRYYPRRTRDASIFEDITVKNNFSVRGTYHITNLSIHQTKVRGDYIRRFVISVILLAPIEICDADGDILATLDDPEGYCVLPYDYIVNCQSDGQFPMPNKGNLAGGRRSKRSQKKRKTRRRTHKKRA
jgi:hypothetical protein